MTDQSVIIKGCKMEFFQDNKYVIKTSILGLVAMCVLFLITRGLVSLFMYVLQMK